MNVGLQARVSRQEMSFRSGDLHYGNLVFRRNSLCSVDITLQEVNVRVLFRERLENRSNLVTGSTPRSLQGDHKVLLLRARQDKCFVPCGMEIDDLEAY